MGICSYAWVTRRACGLKLDLVMLGKPLKVNSMGWKVHVSCSLEAVSLLYIAVLVLPMGPTPKTSSPRAGCWVCNDHRDPQIVLSDCNDMINIV